MSTQHVTLTHVFAAGPGGGNPAPIVLDAAGMTDAEMQAVAREYGHVRVRSPGTGRVRLRLHVQILGAQPRDVHVWTRHRGSGLAVEPEREADR